MKFALFALLISNHAFADLSPVTPGSKADKVAAVAASIFAVKDFKVSGLTYRLVTMDSELNGDLGTTNILLVGQEVGGEAGYDAAFQITPAGEFDVMEVLGSSPAGITVLLKSIGSKVAKQLLTYDPKSHTLKVKSL